MKLLTADYLHPTGAEANASELKATLVADQQVDEPLHLYEVVTRKCLAGDSPVIFATNGLINWIWNDAVESPPRIT